LGKPVKRDQGALLLWSVGSWISHYKCNQCLSPLTLWTRIPLMARCTRYNFIWYIFSVASTGRWFSPSTPVSPSIKTDRHNILCLIKHEHYNTIYALAFLLRWESKKINIAISVSQIMCSIQTAINPIHFSFQTKYAEQNVMLNIIDAKRYALISNSPSPSDN
jgi:hypothetical protein